MVIYIHRNNKIVADTRYYPNCSVLYVREIRKLLTENRPREVHCPADSFECTVGSKGALD